jgi:hypothetical protein
MANHKAITSVAKEIINGVVNPQLAVGELAGSLLPLRYTGGDLGLGNDGDPTIYFVDSTGERYETNSVEWILRNIDHFEANRSQSQLLGCAAVHYGLGAWALFGADMYSIQRGRNGASDSRHEGPLVLLHHNLGVTSFEGIAVKSHVGRCGMMLEEVLWRFDQFGPADQAKLMTGLATHFDLGPRQQGAIA